MKKLPVFLFLLGAGFLHAEPESNVIGRIGEVEVKLDDVRASLLHLGPDEEAAVSKDPALLNQVVRSLLVQKLLLSELAGQQWDQKPEVIAKLQRARESALTESYLQSIATPPDSYPSEQELQAAYDANKASFGIPKQFRVAQIFVALAAGSDKEATDKAQKKLDAIRKSLKQTPASFADLAKKDSDEKDSASRGGEIGWLSEAQIQPEIRAQLPKLELGTISEPVKLNDGWHILKVLDTKEASTATLEQIRPQLAKQLRTEKTQANSQAYLAKLLQDHPLAINELALSKVLPQAAGK